MRESSLCPVLPCRRSLEDARNGGYVEQEVEAAPWVDLTPSLIYIKDDIKIQQAEAMINLTTHENAELLERYRADPHFLPIKILHTQKD